MADSIITHIENLRKKGLHADCEHFIQLMRDKINPLYLSYVSDNRAPGLSDQKLLRQHINPSERTPYVLLEFLRLGLIDVKSLFSTVTQTGGKLSLNLMGQAIAFESKMRKFAPEAMDAIHAEYARLKGENKKIVDDKVLTEQQGTVSSQPPATEPSAEDAFQLAA